MYCERCWKQNTADVHTCTASREYMLEIIQKEISDKTLGFGCYVLWWPYWSNYIILDERHDRYKCVEVTMSWSLRSWDLLKEPTDYLDKIYWIIWHPVMIWNCDRLIEKWPNYFDDWMTILDLWIEKEKPIQYQSDECIRYIYSLLPPEVRK